MADETQATLKNGELAAPKTAKQLEKEAKKQAKLDKLKQKLEKQQIVPKKDTEVSKNICPVLLYKLNNSNCEHFFL